MSKPPVKLDVVAWINQRGSARTHQIAQWAEVGAEKIDAMLAVHVASGALVDCLIKRPGKPDEKEYRPGSGIPPSFRTLDVARSGVAQHSPLAATAITHAWLDKTVTRAERIRRYMLAHCIATSGEIAKALGEDPSSVSAQLIDLTRQNFVRREAIEGAKRLWLYVLVEHTSGATPGDQAQVSLENSAEDANACHHHSTSDSSVEVPAAEATPRADVAGDRVPEQSAEFWLSASGELMVDLRENTFCIEPHEVRRLVHFLSAFDFSDAPVKHTHQEQA
ncbi:MAG: hypothetical protein JWL63_3241 [Rhodocyclales bacterium]|nr:hypothetical protein [Rhodocyclales bacterium]